MNIQNEPEELPPAPCSALPEDIAGKDDGRVSEYRVDRDAVVRSVLRRTRREYPVDNGQNDGQFLKFIKDNPEFLCLFRAHLQRSWLLKEY